ncbi:MAG: glycine cleavage system aminomethyltransferase GcvT [Candidatus Marsarchaeota archaeon]|nr:glycine cleavage system aminomethyltransferase GcvT [Candidatus Marsarchaeota archaeon]
MRTVLYDYYGDKARMIDFNGWEMPVWFTSIEAEHFAVRRNSGVFDVSHMMRTRFVGDAAGELLDKLCTAQIAKARVGKLIYTYVLNDEGGVADDGIVFKLSQTDYLFVTNACTRDRLRKWFREQSEPLGSRLEVFEEPADRGMIAVQGPGALEALRSTGLADLSTCKRFELVTQGPWIASRSGYTGEDGAEVIADGEVIRGVYAKLLSLGVTPCGLGARDTLRLEMGYPLSCVDVDESVNPLELGGERHIDFSKEFIGKSAITGNAPRRRFMGVMVDEAFVLRGGYSVHGESGWNAKLSSGTLSPVLKRGIGLGLLPAEAKTGEGVTVDVRGSRVRGVVASTPFIRKG